MPNAHNKYIIGVDLGGTNIGVGAMSSDGSRQYAMSSTPTPVRSANSSESVVARMVEMVEQTIAQTMEETGAKRSDILGVGIGAPGPLDRENGIVIIAPNLGWHNLPLRSLISDNENRCEERTAVTDASGKIVAWTRTPSQVTPRFARQASEVSAYSILTFSTSSHQQTSQFDCVLQSGSEALPFMKAQLATRHTPAAVRTLGGTIGYSLGGDSGTCEWDGWGLTCEGDACVRGYAAMRAPGASRTAPVPGAAARIEMGALGAWHCGSCNVFISESGSVFNCGDDNDPEGGGDEGGGGCGGGGLLVASCEPPPSQTPLEMRLCPSGTPHCLIPLEPVEIARFSSVIALMDSADTLCNRSAAKLRTMLAAGAIYKGDSLIADSHLNPHDAATSADGLTIHVDTDYLLGSTNHNLAVLLIHEGWHAAGYPNHGTAMPYSTSPWNQADRCVP